jgi:hypothetical protein
MPLQQNGEQGPQPRKGSGQRGISISLARLRHLGIHFALFDGLERLALWPTIHPKVDIPYTVFLAQVRADNVSKVHIVKDAITGSFVKPLQRLRKDSW